MIDLFVNVDKVRSKQALEAAQAAVDLAPESAEPLARLSWAQAGIQNALAGIKR